MKRWLIWLGLALLAAIPWLVGWLLGLLVSLTFWTLAALMDGYHKGRL